MGPYLIVFHVSIGKTRGTHWVPIIRRRVVWVTLEPDSAPHMLFPGASIPFKTPLSELQAKGALTERPLSAGLAPCRVARVKLFRPGLRARLDHATLGDPGPEDIHFLSIAGCRVFDSFRHTEP